MTPDPMAPGPQGSAWPGSRDGAVGGLRRAGARQDPLFVGSVTESTESAAVLLRDRNLPQGKGWGWRPFAVLPSAALGTCTPSLPSTTDGVWLEDGPASDPASAGEAGASPSPAGSSRGGTPTPPASRSTAGTMS